MVSIPVEYPTDWSEYELIDSGDGEKLERFGDYVVSRPDPRIVWKKSAEESVWNRADARFVRTNTSATWHSTTPPPDIWRVHYHTLTFTLRPATFKHTGVFPEQACNWQWIREHARPGLRVLNLFAYTGGATLAAADTGAHVTHVDSSQPALTWARENLDANAHITTPVRFIHDDVAAFVKREVKRQNTYDAIIMDPPVFGRGSKGQVWKLTQDLPQLLDLCKPLLSPAFSFFLLNVYTADISPLTLTYMAQDALLPTHGSLTSGELALQETTSKRLVPHGLFVRWNNDVK